MTHSKLYTQLSPELYTIRYAKMCIEVKCTLFRGKCLVMSTNLIQVDVSSRFEGDLFFLMQLLACFYSDNCVAYAMTNSSICNMMMQNTRPFIASRNLSSLHVQKCFLSFVFEITSSEMNAFIYCISKRQLRPLQYCRSNLLTSIHSNIIRLFHIHDKLLL